MSEVPMNSSLVAMLNLLDGDALGALYQCADGYDTSERKRHEELRDYIVFLCAYVRRLRESRSDLDAFFQDEFWKVKSHPLKEEDVALLAVRFMMNAQRSRGRRYQRALDYSKIVEHFAQGSFDLEGIREQLQQKSLYRLLNELHGEGPTDPRREAMPRAAPNGDVVDEAANDDQRAGGGGSSSGRSSGTDNPPVKLRRRRAAPVPSEPAQSDDPEQARLRSYFDPETAVAIEGDDFLDDVLDLKAGETMSLQIRCLVVDDNWKRYKLERATKL